MVFIVAGEKVHPPSWAIFRRKQHDDADNEEEASDHQRPIHGPDRSHVRQQRINSTLSKYILIIPNFEHKLRLMPLSSLSCCWHVIIVLRNEEFIFENFDDAQTLSAVRLIPVIVSYHVCQLMLWPNTLYFKIYDLWII